MERLTGKGAQSLTEAYSKVYASVLTEEVINNTAEQWVAACIEEDIKFEEYTLDEITEAFIADCEQPEILNEYLGMQGAQDFGANMRQRFGQARRAVGGALANFGRGVKDVAGATVQGLAGQRTTSSNPLARAGNMITRVASAPQRAGAALVGGFLTGKRSGGGTAPAAPAGNVVANKAAPVTQKPPTAQEKAYGPRSTLNKDQQAVNKEYDRLRKSDPEAAAAYGKKMAAAGAANKDFSMPKPTQAQSNPTAAQKQASVDAAIKSVNTPEKMNKQAPAGTALRAQQDKQAAAKPAGGYQLPAGAKPKVAVGGNNPADVKKQPVGAATGSASAPRPRPTGARPMGARNRMRMEELDVFDTIKEYLIGEGATEEEALKQMLSLTDEQRTEIIEGSCGSKKKSKKGGY